MMLDAILFVLVGVPVFLLYLLVGVVIKRRINKSQELHEDDGK